MTGVKLIAKEEWRMLARKRPMVSVSSTPSSTSASLYFPST